MSKPWPLFCSPAPQPCDSLPPCYSWRLRHPTLPFPALAAYPRTEVSKRCPIAAIDLTFPCPNKIYPKDPLPFSEKHAWADKLRLACLLRHCKIRQARVYISKSVVRVREVTTQHICRPWKQLTSLIGRRRRRPRHLRWVFSCNLRFVYAKTSCGTTFTLL